MLPKLSMPSWRMKARPVTSASASSCVYVRPALPSESPFARGVSAPVSPCLPGRIPVAVSGDEVRVRGLGRIGDAAVAVGRVVVGVEVQAMETGPDAGEADGHGDQCALAADAREHHLRH